MFRYVLTSFRGYRLSWLKDDLIAGIIVAALTIPVAMGYAGVAGLPPVYGLYASMLPVLGYILFASSPQMIFGADASSSAITGSCLAALGIVAGSQQAVASAVILSLFAGIFLIIFSVMKLGKFAQYISKSVMSGFISGISFSILFGQIPKILGLAGSGNDFLGNIAALATHIGETNPLCALLGGTTIAAILLGKKYLPKLPVALIVMVLGTWICAVLRLDSQGVRVVGAIPRGLPKLALPDLLHLGNLSNYIGPSLLIAILVFADALMSAQVFAEKNGYALDNNREIFAFGFSNLVASVSGCAPTSGSVSRTAANEQYNGHTQLVSVVAVAVVGIVVAFFISALYYIPQPVLGGVVFTALCGVIEVPQIRRLLSISRNEAVVWFASAVGVLVMGTLFGVIIGVVVSFLDVIIRISAPPQAYLGKLEGRDGFFDLSAHKNAKAIPGIVIYRFSARLFFANFSIFKAGVEKAIQEAHPRAIVFDASGINSIDTTSVDSLKELLAGLDHQGIQYCFAGQTATLNRQFAALQLWPADDVSHIKKTIQDALDAYGATRIGEA